MYGLAARAVRISADGLTYRYLLRPEARFHDGTKLTAHDVAFSLKLLKGKGHPIIGQMTRDLVGAEAEDDATVVLRFAPNRARDVPLFVSALPIFSRAYYSTQAISKRRRSIRRSARVPTRSGVSSPDATSNTTASRIGGARSCRSCAGNTISMSCATSSIATATSRSRASPPRATCSARSSRRAFGRRATIFPPSRMDASSRATLHDDTPSGGQGWFMNTRRDKFKNIGLREAMIHAFDFEWTNKSIMYGAYKRTFSVFQNSTMTAEGKPSAAELELLEPFRGKVPDEVFGEPFMPPVSDGSGQDRAMLRKATHLLQQAGYPIKNNKRVDAKGEPVTSRVPDRRADVPATPHAIHQESRRARHRGEPAYRRSGAVPQARRRVRFRHHDAAFQFLHHAGRLAAQLFFLPIRRA